jgi:hypothetical protein
MPRSAASWHENLSGFLQSTVTLKDAVAGFHRHVTHDVLARYPRLTENPPPPSSWRRARPRLRV